MVLSSLRFSVSCRRIDFSFGSAAALDVLDAGRMAALDATEAGRLLATLDALDAVSQSSISI
jgi:hypothetical protein